MPHASAAFSLCSHESCIPISTVPWLQVEEYTDTSQVALVAGRIRSLTSVMSGAQVLVLDILLYSHWPKKKRELYHGIQHRL